MASSSLALRIIDVDLHSSHVVTYQLVNRGWGWVFLTLFFKVPGRAYVLNLSYQTKAEL